MATRTVIDLRERDVIALDRVHRRLVALVLGVLSVNFVVLAGIQAWHDSFTFDEPVYAVSGSTAIREHDLRINYEHPPLPKVLAAIPAELFADVEIAVDGDAWSHADEWTLATEMYAANRDDIQRITFLYRIVPILIATALGGALYALGSELFGWVAGLLSASLWLTMPIAVGFGHLNGLDVPAALTVVLLLWLLARYTRDPSPQMLVLISLGIGIALLTRAGVGLVVCGAAVATILIWEFARTGWRALAKGLAVAAGGWCVVWLGYLILDPSGFDVGLVGPGTRELLTSPSPSFAARLALLVPWPSGFEAGMRFLAYIHGFGNSPSYLLGQSFTGAPAWFWLGSLLLKLSIPCMTAIAAGVAGLVRLRGRGLQRTTAVLAPITAGLSVMMLMATRAYGIRYLIPVIVVALVVAGAATKLTTIRIALIAIAVVIVMQLGIVWTSHPSSLAWTNPLFGDSWATAVDANVDWGQDFYRLAQWAQGEDEPYIAYFGFGPSWDLTEIVDGVSSRDGPRWEVPMRAPTGQTTFAVSATELNAYERSRLGLLRSVCPVERIGSTILVYRFATPPSSLVADHDGRPEGLCPDAEFSH